MENYDTLTEAVNDLTLNGFTEDFVAESEGVKALNSKKVYQPEEILIIQKYHFEGDTDPDNAVDLFVIEANDGIKGTLVDSYSSAHNNDGTTLRKIPMKS